MMLDVLMVIAEPPPTPPVDYTPTMLTVAGTLLAAGFTSVVSQYFFAPALEARKQTLLERSKVATEAVNSLRAMYFELDTAAVKRFQLGDIFGVDHHESRFQDLADDFDAAKALNNSGLKPKYIALALQAQFAAEIFSMGHGPSEHPKQEEFAPLLRLFRHTMQALDPVTLPWARAFHCWLGGRIYRKLTLPSSLEDTHA